LTGTTSDKSAVEILQNFVAFSEYMNFTIAKINFFTKGQSAILWRNGEDAGLVYQGLAVRAPSQEIFHSKSSIAVLQ
jgi:hypothetical protein